jgi:hypothetical protein
MTKGLTMKTFEAFRDSLSVMPMIHQTARVIKCICIAFIIALDEVFPALLLPTTLSRSCARSVDAPRALAVPLPCKLYKYLRSTRFRLLALLFSLSNHMTRGDWSTGAESTTGLQFIRV